MNCGDCQNFYVTYDVKAPRGCRAFGFKTDSLPYRIVEQETAQPCQKYKPKKNEKRK